MNNAIVRGEWGGSHPHTNAQTSTPFLESSGSHVSGTASVPSHNGHECSGHSVTLDHIHTVNVSSNSKVNGMLPVLEGDEGCWECPCHSEDNIFDFTVDPDDYLVKIEGKTIALEGLNHIDSESIHNGTNGKFTVGGSPDTFIGRTL